MPKQIGDTLLLPLRLFIVALLLMFPVSGRAQTPAPSGHPAEASAASAVPMQVPAAQNAPTATPQIQVPGQAQGTPGGVRALSPWTMFLNADIIVKAVMCGLAFASLVTWTVLIAKSAELFSSRRKLAQALERARGAHTLANVGDAADGKRNILSVFLAAARHEARLSHEADAGNDAGIRERAASLFAEITRNEGRRVRRGMGSLATIGSTAPFVGLFGTVWGIMKSFIGISEAQTTNLAVVAPGIAEALLATAIGLVAAIPAVIIYNHFSRQLRSYLDVVAQASGLAGRLLSRDLDSVQAHPLVAARAAE